VSVFTPTKRQKIPGNLLSRVAEIKILEIACILIFAHLLTWPLD
jgi:hypothetical protein